MNSSIESNEKWTVVGQKKKGGSKAHKNDKDSIIQQQTLKNKSIDDVTPEDIYYANMIPQNENKVDTTAYLTNTIVDKTKEMDLKESLEVFGKVSSFVIDTMSDILKKAISEITNNIKDDQKTVIALNGYLENISETKPVLEKVMGEYNNQIAAMNSLKKTSIENIQKFLNTCGINEIPEYHSKKKTEDEKDNITMENIHMSYASAIGSVNSDLIIEKQPVEIINKISQPRSLMVDTGVVDINIPVISTVQESIGFTLCYLDYCKVFVIRMGNTVFTTGPGNFVDLKNSNGKTKHAKRCLNPQPCQYKNCKYYHDPCIVYDDFNEERNFALSYVLQLLGSVKHNTDLLENKNIRNPNFLRDLVQLGGIILLKAAQIKSLHFSGKNI